MMATEKSVKARRRLTNGRNGECRDEGEKERMNETERERKTVLWTVL